MNVNIPIAEFQLPVLDFHEGHWDEDEFSAAMDLALGEEFLYGKTDLVKVTSMGVHIGSATTHLGICRLFLRKGGKNLSSKSVVKTKEVFYESPVISIAGCRWHKTYWRICLRSGMPGARKWTVLGS